MQLKIWLAKTPGERLIQFLKDNDDMRKALKEAKEKPGLPDTVTNFVPGSTKISLLSTETGIPV